MTKMNGRDETTQPTALERRALAAIWADVDAAVGEKIFGPPEPGLQAEGLFLHWPSRSYADVQRPHLRAVRPAPRSFARDSEDILIVRCAGADERPYEVRLQVRDDGNVRALAVLRAIPPGMLARTARPEEYETVAEVIRDAPVVTGERSFSLWLRRLPEVLAMQGEHRVAVVERQSDGKILATRIFSLRRAVYMGQPILASIAYQAAVLPEARGHGLENVLIAVGVLPFQERVNVGFGYIDAGNHAILQAMGGQRLPRWQNTVRQVGIPALAEASAFGRPATPADAPRILELLAHTHEREEWRPPYSPDWINWRFGTLASYGFDALRLTDNAVLGFWPASDVVNDIAPSRRLRARFAYVCDYGFHGEEGLRDLERLVGDACRRAARADCTHLVAYTSDGSPGRSLLAGLAEFDDQIYLTLRLHEPDTIPQTGIYTDPFFI